MIYFLQQKKHYGFDDRDGEDIEECLIIGYFSSLANVEKAKSICINNGISKDYLDVKTYDLSLNNQQKYVYVLSHSYFIQNDDGTIIDFDYIFEPKSSRKECCKLKTVLLNNPKFKLASNRNYCINPPDGFVIEKYKLDYMVYPVNDFIKV